MSFSERLGIVTKEIQVKKVDNILRNRIINFVNDNLSEQSSEFVLDKLGRIIKRNYSGFVNLENENLKKLTEYMKECEWNELYDIIEYGIMKLKLNCEDCDYNCARLKEFNDGSCGIFTKITKYKKEINQILLEEKSGYRLVEDDIVPITSVMEIETISKCMNTQFDSVNKHIKKALMSLSDRKSPDYSNSIKDSISAVESMCCYITNSKKGTLGNLLDKLDKNGIKIHSALRNAFENLYGYTSDEGGIRHGKIDFSDAQFEDAMYMLVSCSAFINYLIEKYSKISE